jgi:ATP-dependent DNA ligase
VALGIYQAAIAAACEGVVSKRADSRYWSGDTRDWLKIKPAEVRERQAEAIRNGFERSRTRSTATR